MKRKLSVEKKKSLQGLLFLLPFIIGFILFFSYPIIQSLRYSFSEMQFRGVIKDMVFGTLENYQRAFLLDVEFVPTLIQTFLNTIINTPLITIFSLILAIILNKKILLKGFFRGIFFLPFILGTGFVMQLLLGLGSSQHDVDFFRGIALTADLERLFGPAVSLFINDVLRRIVIIFWKSGLQILLFLAGLQSIPPSLFESAKVDGANEWVYFWKITIPIISPVILVIIIYTIVASFSDITNPLLTYILEIGFNRLEYTYAAAMSWVYLFIILIIIGVIIKSIDRFIYKTDKA